MASFSDEYREAYKQRSRDEVEKGGIPLEAEWRLKRLRESREPTPAPDTTLADGQPDWTQTYQPRTVPKKHPLFTSNLSVSELALCASIGMQPLGQVMGAATYHVGWQIKPFSPIILVSTELTMSTRAQLQARRLALGRLQQEATLIGADGVIGVRMQRRKSRDVIEYVALGTAIRLAGDRRHNTPFVAAVSVQELWMLMQAGHFPVGLVFGGCVRYHVATFSNRMKTSDLGRPFGRLRATTNMELPDYTSAVYAARGIAMARVQAEAAALGADGIVGVEVEKHIETHEVDVPEDEMSGALAGRRRDLIVHFSVTGSAIMPCAGVPHSISYQVPLD